ncbi:hypothetical protein GCM10010112_69570 [Actinoplanes lobatus]|uniref:Uncharacterized protein n=1 Tax=Actinoplanes lobatus TaxID=113568 RepID=A0A7W7HM26_9ACTN|nr:hypothetical protein [Actinoplanes lobatus]MBB4753066.1 hypothetical protein [Actinoplanes lobatus]GGN87189.1 hypothetical protein GCM10010112_69570 [Actinoplanes lobatus]GIE39673.1 hypothetical protein Alo02nite_25710 [Actinoplanes lobatus]
MSVEVDAFAHGVPWGVLRIEGIGSGGSVPELDIEYSMTAANSGCVLIAVTHIDIEPLRVVVVREGVPDSFVQMFSGELNAPESVIEVADVVGDDFGYRYSLSTDKPKVTIFADVPEEATEIYVVVPGIQQRLSGAGVVTA